MDRAFLHLKAACSFCDVPNLGAIMKNLNLDTFLSQVAARDPHQPEFMQAVKEVMGSLWPFVKKNPHYADQALLQRLVEPERVIQFRVV